MCKTSAFQSPLIPVPVNHQHIHFAKQQTADGLGFADGGGGDLSKGFKHASVHASKAVGHGRLKGDTARPFGMSLEMVKIFKKSTHQHSSSHEIDGSTRICKQIIIPDDSAHYVCVYATALAHTKHHFNQTHTQSNPTTDHHAGLSFAKTA